ncbi:hypothetical protein THIX_90194 [Thiomonas sp. X19]|uniref:Uncharacterized protein n=1 Tax=mine drainage metagenome TaxID=410659 RepID=E6PLG5_9ZZZZ|nr:hypothetical protein [Thiomonas sp. X19]SCC95425.1 hypothetical protein THIX_90194 [Thiomonas sp. X19]
MTQSKPAELRIVAGDVVTPTPPKNRVRLHTLDDMRLELGKVYNDMRDNSLDPATGTKLAYVLGQMVRIYEVHELERRTEALERALKLQLPPKKG